MEVFLHLANNTDAHRTGWLIFAIFIRVLQHWSEATLNVEVTRETRSLMASLLMVVHANWEWLLHFSLLSSTKKVFYWMYSRDKVVNQITSVSSVWRISWEGLKREETNVYFDWSIICRHCYEKENKSNANEETVQTLIYITAALPQN